MLKPSTSSDFIDHFRCVNDPRIERHRAHRLIDILFISVAATLAGADGPSDIESFATEKLDWCRKFVPLANGVPSHDTIGRVLGMIKPLEFQKAFLDWVASFVTVEPSDRGAPRFIPIDGKTARGSRGAKDRENPLHIVSAWATEQGVSLGQVAVDAKSNEITAIPKLLQMLELEGAIVSIDAMGCQKDIAATIIKGGGDYVLAVKDNQPTLAEAIHDFFLQRHEYQDFADYGVRCYTTTETSRGRIETRCYYIAPLPLAMRGQFRAWTGLRSIGQVITTVVYDGKETSEVRNYISSRPPKVREFAKSTRGHWAIEAMHWILDVVFAEDKSRIRNASGTENFSALRKFVLGLLKRDTSKGSLVGKRKRAAWSTKFLERLLFG
jgi:predicted transposase YbfD/YdcC